MDKLIQVYFVVNSGSGIQNAQWTGIVKLLAIYWQTVDFSAYLCNIKIILDVGVKFN